VTIHGPVPEIKDIFLELLRDLKTFRVRVEGANTVFGKRPKEMKMVTEEG
jgi:hypothetical protein